MKRITLIVLFTVLAVGCATVGLRALDQLYGPEHPDRFDAPVERAVSAPDFIADVKPILDGRCVVCHACYDAPCQLQLGSYEGVTRGANPRKIYDTARLVEVPTTRLFFDADTNAVWRKKGFFAVLNERNSDPETNIKAGILAKMVTLKNDHPGPSQGVLPADSFDFSLDRPQVCAGLESISEYMHKHPDWGMPFGFPALDPAESRTLIRWLESGAPATPKKPLPSAHEQRIATWESFLNADDLKSRLMARYVYEHWFLAHLYFDDLPPGTFFELVRSATPPGQPIQLIATRRPYDDPGVKRVFYRLRPIEATLVSKTHMPYALNNAKLARIRAWFVDLPYPVDQLPGYEPDASSNPFITFKAIPPNSRYRLMLDEAQFTVMGFIKGPSCRGQTALDVIDDHFWIGFVNPDLPELKDSSKFLSEVLTHMYLPTRDRSTALLGRWLTYAEQQNAYLLRKAAYFDQMFKGKTQVTMNDIWDGDGTNPNATLTVFRHFDSASVEQGLLGDHPQKALIIGYEVLERVHYLLVAGFDVYGNVGHQLEARLYMDFLRMEAEHNVLIALPKSARIPVRDHWYRGATEDVRAYLQGARNDFDQETGIVYKTQDPLNEFYEIWKARTSPVQSHRYDLNPKQLGPSLTQALTGLSLIKGRALSYLPESSFLMVERSRGGAKHFTLLRNSAHSNIAELFNETNRRLPDEDTLYLASGFIGAYPNVFLKVKESELPEFTRLIATMNSEKDYEAFASRFAVRRTDPGFWAHSDRIRKEAARLMPVEAAVFDLNRYENR
ncbi:MAG: hypothetical protein RLZ25_1256 [Pseudomonadota bacterium]|jgi:hypothetical protein